MTVTLTKIPLSGSTDGLPIKVAATSIGSGTAIHTATTGATAGLGDEVVLYCFNSDSVSRVLTLGWGGTTSPDDLLKFTIPAGEFDMCIPGLLVRNSLVILASGDAANVLIITGYAVRAS